MFTYADPRACPGCRAPLATPVHSCAACGLPLTGPAPGRVFESLTEVDRLVTAMYADAARVLAPDTAHDTAAASPVDPAPVRPTGVPATRAGGLGAASVPKILLGLGALCLVVAAVVFLAVAWAALGVGGRTGVLVGLTIAAACVTAWLARRDLRAGVEAFACVSLGLLSLDLTGAWRAGWLGGLGEDPFLLVAGTVVAVAAATTARWAATTPVGDLVSAQGVGVLGVLAASLGAPDTLAVDTLTLAALAGLLLCATAAVAADRLRLPVLAIGTAVGAVGWWCLLLVGGVADLGELTLAHLWGDLAIWPLVAAAACAGATALLRRFPQAARVLGAAVAVALGTLAVTVAAFDESAVRLALVELAVVGTVGALAWRLPDGWRWVCAAPSVTAALALGTGAVRLAVESTVALLVHEPWGTDPLEPLVTAYVPWTWPLLLPAGVLAAAVSAATIILCAGSHPRVVLVPGTALLLLSLPLVLPWYGVPLAVAVVALLVVALLVAVAGARSARDGLLLVGVGGSFLALGAALANPWLTATVLAVLTLGAVAAEVLPPRKWAAVGACTSPFAAALLWTLQHLAGVDPAIRPLPVLVVLGVAVVLLPGVGREIAGGLASLGVLVAFLLSTSSLDQAWLAVHLTVAGVVAVASSLVNRERRHMAWVGLGCLTLAQWVRLEQLGVGTVEAYTLPLALVLLATGAVTLLRGEGSSSTELGPGLVLAVVPTLLQVMVDPVDARAVLLGLGCLVLVAAGVRLGWAAPLVAGTATLALVVLRQGTLAEVLPQWLLIGLVGIVLTVVGVTWERRLVELRRVSAYVRGLR